MQKGAIAEAKSFGNQDFKDFRDSSLLKNLFDVCSDSLTVRLGFSYLSH